ncbi:MAG: PEP-CTERM sorting domain-containing protein [Planctomycetota bacterium]
MRYTNIPPALTLYENDDLKLTGGIGKGSPPFTGSTFASRMWNGTVYYDVVPEPAALALLGLGFALVRRR